MRRAWVAALPQRLSVIEAGLETLLEGSWEPAQAHEIHRRVHTLAGSGATFGLAAASAAARSLELVFQSVAEGGAPPTPAQVAALRERLGALTAVPDALAPDASEAPSPAPTAHPRRAIVTPRGPAAAPLLLSIWSAQWLAQLARWPLPRCVPPLLPRAAVAVAQRGARRGARVDDHRGAALAVVVWRGVCVCARLALAMWQPAAVSVHMVARRGAHARTWRGRCCRCCAVSGVDAGK